MLASSLSSSSHPFRVGGASREAFATKCRRERGEQATGKTQKDDSRAAFQKICSVSYTHLTLPTILLV
eukprot:8204195-Pyramimonas_sp.AAC.1